MPKKKPRDPRAGKGRTSNQDSDEDSVFNDGASVVSVYSEASNVQNDFFASNKNSDDDEAGSSDATADEIFEDKLRDCIDLATQKSAKGRTEALRNLQKAFAKRLVPDFVEGRVATFADLCERAIKKGKADEQVEACKLAVYVCVQLENSGASEELYKELTPALSAGVADASANPKARAAMATALGLLCFMGCVDLNEFPVQMSTLERIFSASTGANAGKLGEDVMNLHTAALDSWTLLATMLNSTRALKLLECHASNFGALLESPSVDLRIAAGEALVVLFEMSLDLDEDEAYKHIGDLVDSIKHLATDSQKHRSKKDRKEQKSLFREILKYVEDESDFYEKHACSDNREHLEIFSWTSKIQYDAIIGALGSGTQLHLAENELIRDIFGMGPPLPSLSEVGSQKLSKAERHSANQQAFKWRTQTRGKNRDKRSAIIH